MNYKSLIYTALTALFITSCSDFEEINENPNQPTEVGADVLLTTALRNSVQTTSNEAFLLSNNIAQLSGKALRAEVDNYNWNAFPTLWEGLYGSLTDIESALNIASASGNEKAQGALLVLKSWIYSQLTNAYGDIPYSSAIQGANAENPDFTPAYDSQEQIYSSLLANLSTATDLLSGSGSISGDILYNGDEAKWIKFANALRLRLLMYQSAKTDVSSAFAAIVNNEPLFEGNEDQAALSFLNAFPNQFPTIPLKQGDFDAVALSSSSHAVLAGYNDPRLSRYARPDNEDFDNPTFSAIDNGVGGQTGSRLGLAYFDYPGQTTAQQIGLKYAEGLMMTYAEQQFLLAEAAALGWINNDVETHYKSGIKASHDYYQVNYSPYGFEDFEDFYINSGVAYDEVIDIWEQKWLSLFFTAMEPYFELRRWYVSEGGFDNLRFVKEPIGTNYNDYELPMRFLYPGQEQSLNQENYNAAKAQYNGINGKMWILSN